MWRCRISRASPLAPPAAAPAATQGSNTALKVILAVVGVFVFIGVLMAGSCFYIGYRVKKRATNSPRKWEAASSLHRQARTLRHAFRRCRRQSSWAARYFCGAIRHHDLYLPLRAGNNQRLDVTYTWQGWCYSHETGSRRDEAGVWHGNHRLHLLASAMRLTSLLWDPV